MRRMVEARREDSPKNATNFGLEGPRRVVRYVWNVASEARIDNPAT
jgi:hypothetical protein